MNNPWKVTVIAVSLVLMTAIVTGAVVANWTAGSARERVAVTPQAEPLKSAATRMAVAAQSSALATPPRATVQTCNQQASMQASYGLLMADGKKSSTNLHILMNWQKQGSDWKLLSRSATKLG